MRKKLKISLLLFTGILAVAFASDLRAADWDKKTKLTVNEPIEVPGAVLQPGNYVLKLVEFEANRHVVRFMNEEENEVISTVIAIPNSRLEPTGDTEFEWYETPANQPPAMRAWFYPGDTFGQEFVYDDKRAQELAVAAKRNVMTVSSQDNEQLRAAAKPEDPAPPIYRSTQIAVARPDRTKDNDLAKSAEDNQKMDQARTTRRTVSVTSQPDRSNEALMAQNRRPASTQNPTTRSSSSRTELPETAGIASLLGLAGLASLAGSFGIGVIRRRHR